MNSKVLTKRTSAIFLAIVLVTGTIAALSTQSFIIGAQAQPYYYDGGMDNRYNNYEPSQYQPSYKPDYKAKYPSDNNNYKSKDSKKSVSINKINCINNNINNINSNNTGDVDVGNNGQVAPGASGGNIGASSADGGYSGERYNDGYDNKKDKGFECIIDNNNNIVVNAGAGGDNVTDGSGNVTLSCEECFTQNLNLPELNDVLQTLSNDFGGDLQEFCDFLMPLTQLGVVEQLQTLFSQIEGIEEDEVNAIVECLREIGIPP